jgi:Domain of unknown function (DUF932)
VSLSTHTAPDVRPSHQGSFIEHAQAAKQFFSATLRELDFVAEAFTRLSERQCDDNKLNEILFTLLPEPKRPRNWEKNPGLQRAWEHKVADVREAHKRITELRMNGKGMNLPGSPGTFWGVLNAILEFVDHHRKIDGPRITYALLGDGMDLKMRAFRMLDELAKAA